jgi:hypothetical protein
MNEQDLARFETQAAETVGAMKELFKEFERRLGEVVSAQRLASSEASNEVAKARATLQALLQAAGKVAGVQKQVVQELRDGWKMHVAENSKASGKEMARAFGEEITTGLQQGLKTLTYEVTQATHRFGWMSALTWGSGIAVGIALSIGIGVWALVPSVEGLSTLQVREAMARLAPCHVGQETHVCAAIEDKSRAGKEQNGQALAMLKGL